MNAKKEYLNSVFFLKMNINKVKEFVKNSLKNAEGGHDYWHAIRVYNNAVKIHKTESGDIAIISAAALLHDIADIKFHNKGEDYAIAIASDFLFKNNYRKTQIEHITEIIKNISFKGGHSNSYNSTEFKIVQDADRLDAIGAIGIARTFNYGGFKNREIYNPNIPPQDYKSAEEYRKSTAPTINHFYEKLFKLKDLMNTKTGKKLAQERHTFMEMYLEQFFKEWGDC